MIEHIEGKEFNNLCDEIKKVNIGQKMMQHLLECESCRKLAEQLNTQSVQHIRELEKLT